MSGVRRPGSDALMFAAEWLGTYRGEPGDPYNEHAEAVRAWLLSLVEKSSDDAFVRAVGATLDRPLTVAERTKARRLAAEWRFTAGDDEVSR